jgi:hypothetical protein
MHWEFEEPRNGWDLIRSIRTLLSDREKTVLIPSIAGNKISKKGFHGINYICAEDSSNWFL